MEKHQQENENSQIFKILEVLSFNISFEFTVEEAQVEAAVWSCTVRGRMNQNQTEKS